MSSSFVFLALLTVLLAQVLAYFQWVPFSLVMVATAVGTVVAGALLSLKISHLLKGEDEDNDIPCISTSEALKFPVVASMCLVVTYSLLKKTDPAIVSTVCKVYFAGIGTIGLKGYLQEGLAGFWGKVLPKSGYKATHKIPCSKKSVLVAFGWSDCVCYALSAGVNLAYFSSGHWALNNLLAVVFCLFAIEKTSTGGFKNAVILLCGLFVIDGLWVVATDVMATIGTGLDVPIRFLFPKSRWGEEMAMLGLGDVIFPGMLLGLAYRFDYFLSCKKEQKGRPKYFLACLCSYFLGLGIAYASMMFFDAGQATLLFVVPCVVGGVYGLAGMRRELREVNNYKED